MAIETEVKLPIADLELFRANLGRLNPVRISERHFEDNYVLDFPNAQMRSRGRLLRIRITSGASFLTFKEAALPEGPFKIREEVETQVRTGSRRLTSSGGPECKSGSATRNTAKNSPSFWESAAARCM